MFVRFIRVRVGSLACAKVSSGTFGFALVHSRAPRCCRVYSSSRGFNNPARLRVRPDSRGFTRARLGVVVFIRFRVGSLRRNYLS